MRRALSFVAFALLTLAGAGGSFGPARLLAQAKPKTAAPVVAGTGTFYVGSYKGVIYVIDEATEKITAEIPVTTGIPGRVLFSNDRSKMYVGEIGYEKIEIIDREAKKTLDVVKLSEGKTKTRIWGMQPDPFDKYLILLVKNYTLDQDHWEIGPPTLVQYDLATRKIARTIPWPNGDERERVGVIFSPDGKLMYIFADEILIYDTATFTQVDKWDLAQPLEPGGGRVSFGGIDPFSDAPGFHTGILTMLDPLQNRRIMGIGRVDLVNKKIDFKPVGPARGLAFSVAPDHKRAYGLFSDIGEYEFWTFDLDKATVTARTPFDGRPRMSQKVSSNGNFIYVYTAGNTIDYFDVATMKKVRTLTLDGDMTSLTLLPPTRK